MKSKKVNPRKRPANGADVEKAKKDATNEAIKRILYLVLYKYFVNDTYLKTHLNLQ